MGKADPIFHKRGKTFFSPMNSENTHLKFHSFTEEYMSIKPPDTHTDPSPSPSPSPEDQTQSRILATQFSADILRTPKNPNYEKNLIE